MKNCCKNCGYLVQIFQYEENGEKKETRAFPGVKNENGIEMNPNLFKCYKYSIDGDVIDPNSLEDEGCCDDFDAQGVPYTNF